MNEKQRRLAYAAEMGEQRMERQIIATARAEGCTCPEKLILANRIKGAHAGHDSGCPRSAEANFTH